VDAHHRSKEKQMKAANRAPWLGIELRHLAALSAVAREQSFRGAAESLGYVQSAVSQQLAHLEQLVGARLVERRRGASRVALTDAGKLVLHHFDEILERFVAAQADVEALRDGRAGRLRVGVFESVAARLVPRILAGFGRSAPGFEVELHEARDPATLAERMETGELDVAFGIAPLPSGPFEAHELLSDPYRLLLPAGWKLPSRPGPEDMAGLPLIGGDDDRVEDQLRARGAEPRIVLRSTSDAAVQALVAAEIGAAIVPRLSVNPNDDRTVALELGDLIAPRLLVLYRNRERRRAAAVDTFTEASTLACLETFTEGRSYVLAA
jgi:molybdate transport repressor ModE-like protein